MYYEWQGSKIATQHKQLQQSTHTHTHWTLWSRGKLLLVTIFLLIFATTRGGALAEECLVEFAGGWVGGLVRLQNKLLTPECVNLKFLQYAGMHHGSS